MCGITFYAHSNGENKEDWQLLKEHLINTADLVVEFSKEFSTEEFARNLGMAHDIGKYQKSFQDRLEGATKKVEHSTAGAKEFPMLNAQYCIVGHHSGLPDIGTKSDNEEASTLLARLKRKLEDYSTYKEEINFIEIKECPIKYEINNRNEIAFWIRMMYSCLTDADYLDTEQFFDKDISRGNYIDFQTCLDKLDKVIQGFIVDTEVRKARNKLRLKVMSHIEHKSEIYLLNMPTGSGKTLTSMQFALNRAIKEKKKHIIYVIPFTSIIEQNAKVFKEILGMDAVLEHHCNFKDSSIEEQDLKAKLLLGAENWDCSIIVTTNVRFFESIYSNKSSDLRKLHNIADSILIFDEVHMIPTKFFQPCLEAVQILVQQYNSEAIFMSATMPNFKKWLDTFCNNEIKTLDLINDKLEYEKFKRSKIINLGEIAIDNLLEKVEGKSLIVVNKRQTAKDVYDKLSGKKFHLSTNMTHFDRERVVEKVKKALLAREDFCLVSTSLIEAGVDLDFDFAYREMVGLDNLLQTSGRCNREGEKDNAVTYSFIFTDESAMIKNKDIINMQYFLKETFELFEDVTSLEAIEYYFNRLYEYTMSEREAMNFSNYITSIGYKFKSYAEKFKFIDENTATVIIVTDDTREMISPLMEKLRYVSSSVRRELQKFAISLRLYEYEDLLKQGVIKSINGIDFLVNENYYSQETGILFADETDYYY